LVFQLLTAIAISTPIVTRIISININFILTDLFLPKSFFNNICFILRGLEIAELKEEDMPMV